MQGMSGSGGMDFGDVLHALRAGAKAARSGWNGKGMFIYLVPGSTVAFDDLRGPAKDAARLATWIEGGGQGSSRFVCPHIDMKNSFGQLVIGWTPSQEDMLATDWALVVSPS